MPASSSNPPAVRALCAIVYVSTAVHAMETAELEWLLGESRGLNLENGITGVLLYGDGNFMQYFEGGEAAMKDTYERIVRSRRHKDIYELMSQPVETRSFPDWQMGLAHPSRSEMLALTTARWNMRARAAGTTAPMSAGLELLLNFWRDARR